MAGKQINLETVNFEELTSIEGVTDDMAEKILEKRSQKNTLDATDLQEITQIPREKWDDLISTEETVLTD